MQYRKLGHTDIDVSVICLGTMTWGQQNTQEQAFGQLDYALEQGVTFVDTAEMYPVPPMDSTYSATETIIGNWLHERQNRDQIVLASKVVGRAPWLSWIRDGNPCLDQTNIRTAIEASLLRLQTDYLDLYQIHWPDRKTNFFGRLDYKHSEKDEAVAVEETLTVLGELVHEGKIRHVGISNETPWGVHRYLTLSADGTLPRIVSIQNPYSLVNRSFEVGLAEMAVREQVGLLAYSPLGFGVLSGKYLDNAQPEGARLSMWGGYFTRYLGERAVEATRAYVQIAHDAGLDPAQMALAFVNTRPFVTANIIGATTMEQLRSNIASIDLALPTDVLKALQNVHEASPNPAP